jgi:hypothetical protein
MAFPKKDKCIPRCKENMFRTTEINGDDLPCCFKPCSHFTLDISYRPSGSSRYLSSIFFTVSRSQFNHGTFMTGLLLGGIFSDLPVPTAHDICIYFNYCNYIETYPEYRNHVTPIVPPSLTFCRKL